MERGERWLVNTTLGLNFLVLLHFRPVNNQAVFVLVIPPSLFHGHMTVQSSQEA